MAGQWCVPLVRKLFLVVVLVISCNVSAVLPYRHSMDYVADPNFTYDPYSSNGPSFWHKLYPNCRGTSQSPIDLRHTECPKSPKKPIVMLGTDIAPKSVRVINDRYTVKFLLTWYKNRHPIISGEDLGVDNRFIPRDIHFHWGNENDRGSEHLIEGKRHALEMHIVCYNKRYGSVANATNNPDGVMVISQLFYATSFAKKYFFSDFIGMVKETGSEVKLSNHLCRFALDELILVPAHEWNYARYSGSFTTPPCYENVTWLVFLHPQPVSPSQLYRFRQIQGLKRHIGDNFRPIQKRTEDHMCQVNAD